jgi:hypothetical protein
MAGSAGLHPARHSSEDKNMDAERINLIGTTLSDLQARTHDLRGYL